MSVLAGIRIKQIKHQLSGTLAAVFEYCSMHLARKTSVPTEQRRERRYILPLLEVVIGDERFCAINWSMRGALLYGICEFAGVRVRGEMGVPGSSEAIPFAATVIRTDLDTGNSAICFEDFRSDSIEFHEHVSAVALQ